MIIHSSLSPVFLVYIPLPHEEIYPDSVQLQSCGGCLALYLLVRELKSIGYPTEFTGIGNTSKTEKYQQLLASGEIIAIYPEPITGNPLKAKKVVRWVMYHIDDDRIAEWERSSNIIFFYWKQFHPEKKDCVQLRALDGNLEYFFQYNREKSGICYRIGKGHNYHTRFTYHEIKNLKKLFQRFNVIKKIDGHSIFEDEGNGPIQLGDRLTLKQMREAFNRYKIFISYDCDSAVSIIAALCGCLSIIVPKKGICKQDLLPCFKYGVAYGVENIPHALRTGGMLRGFIKELENEGKQTVKNFARFVTNDKNWK